MKNSTQANRETANRVINYTNQRIENWFKVVKEDYGVIGSGVTSIEGNEIKVDFVEDGVENTWKMSYYPEYVEENGIEYFFNVWMDELRLIEK